MATTTATVARNLLKNSKSLPQIIRGQILGWSNVIGNVNNIAKDHQIVQSLFVSNQKLHAQIPIFYFSEMGSFLGSSGGLSLVQNGVCHGTPGAVVEARGKRVVEDDDDNIEEFDDDDDDGEFDDVDDFFDHDDDDEEEEEEDGKFDHGKYRKKF